MNISRSVPCLLLLLLTTPLGRAAEAEVRVPASFQRLQKAIGVEPTGGHFEALIPAGARVGTPAAVGSGELALRVRSQPLSVLSIYATNGDSLRQEAPLARYQITGLRPGQQESRLKVSLSVGEDRILHVSASDLARPGAPLGVTLLTPAALAAMKLPPIAETTGPAPIASSEAALPHSVGLRVGGGLYEPLLRAGALPGATASFTTRLRYPGQTTADITLYEGESPFSQQNKLAARYIVTGIPASPQRTNLMLKVTVGQKGKLEPLRVTDATGKQEFHIEKYTVSAARRYREDLGGVTPAPVRPAPGT